MLNISVKRKIGTLWPLWPMSRRKIILLYHSIGNSIWSTSESDFSQQINWLYDHCHVLPLTDLIKSTPSNDVIQVALTFDDGYTTLFDNVAPKLSRKNIQGMLYINTGWIAESTDQRKQSIVKLGHYPDEFFLTWPEVKELQLAGWEIGSHGVNHYNFTQVSNIILEQELTFSKRDIEMHLNVECNHFSYPWGKLSTNVKTKVEEAGYQYAVGGRHGSINLNTDLYALPRINIAKNYSLEDFKNIIKGKWDYLGLLHKMKGL